MQALSCREFDKGRVAFARMVMKVKGLENRLSKLIADSGGCVVIDGGLATQLERHGANINDPLWSALCLITMPDLIKKVHREYLDAGAQIIITASYQATLQRFEEKGLSVEEGKRLLRRSVELASEARDEYLETIYKACEPPHPLIAASIGSYGAYLADGSEYSGEYGEEMTLEKLKDFHRQRLQVLVEAGPDLLAFETIPNKLEAQAYIELLEEEDIKIPSWLSFNSKDGINLVNGDSFVECVFFAEKCSKIVAVGINCTPPRFVHGLICSASKVTTKPIIIYPNSGESWDAEKKEWVPSTGVLDTDFISYVYKWREVGASLIGGCCRTTPSTILAISNALHANCN